MMAGLGGFAWAIAVGFTLWDLIDVLVFLAERDHYRMLRRLDREGGQA